MNKVLYSGSEQKLFEVDKNKHPYNNDGEINPYVVQEYIVRTTSEETVDMDVEDVAWDCDTGLLIYGKSKNIESIFKKIKLYLKSTLDEEEDNDLPNVGSPSRFALFKSSTNNLSFIIGHGSYVDLDEELQELLDNSKGIVALTTNNDDHPIHTMEELAGYCDLDDSYYQDILTEIAAHKTS